MEYQLKTLVFTHKQLEFLYYMTSLVAENIFSEAAKKEYAVIMDIIYKELINGSKTP
jgi:hypothetical protein